MIPMQWKRILAACVVMAAGAAVAPAQRGGGRGPSTTYVLKPARVFDGDAMHEGWAVRVRGDRIEAAGPATGIDPDGAQVVDLPQTTLMPGMVEGHSHILLHSYSETSWNDQVEHEGLALRVDRKSTRLNSSPLRHLV